MVVNAGGKSLDVDAFTLKVRYRVGNVSCGTLVDLLNLYVAQDHKYLTLINIFLRRKNQLTTNESEPSSSFWRFFEISF